MREVVWKSLKAGLPAPIYMEVYAFWQAAKRTEGGERRNGRLLGANGKLQKKIPFFKRSDYYQNLQPTQVICPDYKFLFILFFSYLPLSILCVLFTCGGFWACFAPCAVSAWEEWTLPKVEDLVCGRYKTHKFEKVLSMISYGTSLYLDVAHLLV